MSRVSVGEGIVSVGVGRRGAGGGAGGGVSGGGVSGGGLVLDVLQQLGSLDGTRAREADDALVQRLERRLHLVVKLLSLR